MLQNKAKSTLEGPDFSSYFCLVCGGGGFKKIPQISLPFTPARFAEYQIGEAGELWAYKGFHEANARSG